jgi:hypothetical protein
MTTYLTPAELINRLESVKKQLRDSSSRLQIAKPEAASFRDARAAWFVGTRKVIIQVQADMLFMEQCLSKSDWWQRYSPDFSPKDLKDLLQEYQHGRFFLLFHLAVSQLEEALRRVFEYVISQPSYSGQSISKITNELLDYLGCPQLKELFRLTRTVRNTIHTNGIYRPRRRGGTCKVEWKGQTFEFRDGWPPNIGWDFLIWLLLELNEAMCSIATELRVLALKSIPRWTEFQP